MRSPIPPRLSAWLALCALCSSAAVLAQEPVVDPPGRVARLSLMEGEVSLAPAGTDEWAEAVLNRPLTTGDKVWVERGGRAELQVGSALIHLDESTSFGFTDLDDETLRMSLTEGSAVVRIRRRAENEVIEVYTPNATVALLHPGEYQIAVNEAGDQTVVRTRSGESEVNSNGQAYRVRAQQEGVFTGVQSLRADIGTLGPRTAFENWANERDQRDRESVSSRYVSRDVIGYEDLDEHGRWIHEPAYGYVWRPRYVVSDWAPYRYGRWVWIEPWGWTWVDKAPWGFAPFHYGRWAHIRSRWCWVPGPRHYRPVYAPALVGWTGGSSVSVSVSLGYGVGWFPLAPREVYVPGYPYSHRYLRNVNVSNTIIVNNIYVADAYRGRGRFIDYRHRHLPHAVTVVQRDHFVRGHRVDRDRWRMSDRDLRQWPHQPRPPAIAPVRESVFAGTPRTEGPPGDVRRADRNPKWGRGDVVRPQVRAPAAVSRADRPAARGFAPRAEEVKRLESRPSRTQAPRTREPTTREPGTREPRTREPGAATPRWTGREGWSRSIESNRRFETNARRPEPVRQSAPARRVPSVGYAPRSETRRIETTRAPQVRQTTRAPQVRPSVRSDSPGVSRGTVRSSRPPAVNQAKRSRSGWSGSGQQRSSSRGGLTRPD